LGVHTGPRCEGHYTFYGQKRGEGGNKSALLQGIGKKGIKKKKKKKKL